MRALSRGVGPWAYRVARQYAERYDSRYGVGLIPASAPAVEDIGSFWQRYYSGKGLAGGRGSVKEPIVSHAIELPDEVYEKTAAQAHVKG